MSDQPRIVARAAQPYVAVTERVTLNQSPRRYRPRFRGGVRLACGA